MNGSDIATVLTAVVAGFFSLSVVALPLVLGRRSALQAKAAETTLPYQPSGQAEIVELVHRNRRELHLRLDAIESLMRDRGCPFSDGKVRHDAMLAVDRMRRG